MAVFIVLLVLAALSDYCRRRIPNGVIVLLLICGIVNKVLQVGSVGAFKYAAAAVCVGALFYPLLKIGAMGAGDVKLFAVVSGALTIREIVCFLCVSFLVAAILAIARMLLNGNMLERIGVFLEYAETIVLTGEVTQYPVKKDKWDSICLAGPILLGFLCCKGGIY